MLCCSSCCWVLGKREGALGARAESTHSRWNFPRVFLTEQLARSAPAHPERAGPGPCEYVGGSHGGRPTGYSWPHRGRRPVQSFGELLKGQVNPSQLEVRSEIGYQGGKSCITFADVCIGEYLVICRYEYRKASKSILLLFRVRNINIELETWRQNIVNIN